MDGADEREQSPEIEVENNTINTEAREPEIETIPIVERHEQPLLEDPVENTSQNKTQKGESTDGNIGKVVFSEEWLTSIGLTEYWQLFVAEGYEDFETVSTLTDQELIGLGIDKGGHRKKLLLRIGKADWN
eukprot:867435_1